EGGDEGAGVPHGLVHRPMVGEAAMAIVADEIVERPFILVERDGARVAHGGVEIGAVGGVFGGDLFGSLFVRAQNRGKRAGGETERGQGGDREAACVAHWWCPLRFGLVGGRLWARRCAPIR